MAANGLRLDRFYAAHPSCSPTRGSVLTGRHPNRYGTFSPNWSMRPEEVTIAHLLREAGYATGHFGKWHVGPVKAASPTNPGAMGFDEWLSYDNFFEMNPSLSRNGEAPTRFEGESSRHSGQPIQARHRWLRGIGNGAVRPAFGPRGEYQPGRQQTRHRRGDGETAARVAGIHAEQPDRR